MLDLKMIKTGTLPILSDKYQDKIVLTIEHQVKNWCYIVIKSKLNQVSYTEMKRI